MGLGDIQIDSQNPAPEPPPEAEYREGTPEANCGNCIFYDANYCDLWNATVSEDMISDGYEPDDSDLIPNNTALEDQALRELNLRDVGDQPRWPKGTLGGLGGKYMKINDIMKQIDTKASVDISGIAQGYNNVQSINLEHTSNPAWLLYRAGIGPKGHAAIQAPFLIARKLITIDTLTGLTRRLNAGYAVRSIVVPGVRKFTRQKYYNPYEAVRRTLRQGGRGISPGPGALSEDQEELMMELGEFFCADTLAFEEDNLIWKASLPVGTLKVSKDHYGRPVHKPLRVVEGHSTNQDKEIGLQDIVDAFEAGAIQHVTVPESHDDKPSENTGFVRKVKIGETVINGEKRQALFCGVDITEPEVKGKIKRGTIANVSVGLGFDYVKKDDAKVYPVVLRHLALTNKPWVPGMQPFGSDGHFSEDSSVLCLEMEDGAEETQDSLWEKARGLFWRRDRLTDAVEKLGDKHELIDFDGDAALVADPTGKTVKVVPYKIDGELAALDANSGVPLSAEEAAGHLAHTQDAVGGEEQPETKDGDPEDSVVTDPVEEEKVDEPVLVAAGVSTPETELADVRRQRQLRLSEASTVKKDYSSKEVKKMDKEDKTLDMSEITSRMEALEAENRELKAGQHVAAVDARIEELKAIGFDEHPGLLRVARELLLADDGGLAAVLLSEDGAKTSVSVTDVVNRLLDALPRDKENKLALSEQHTIHNQNRPNDEEEGESKVEDRVTHAQKFLAGEIDE